MPDGVELYSTEEKDGGWIIQFRAKYRKENHNHQIMMNDYYDKKGKEYYINSWSTRMELEEFSEEENKLYFVEEVRLTDYHQNEVWLSPAYSHEWKAKEPVVVEIK